MNVNEALERVVNGVENNDQRIDRLFEVIKTLSEAVNVVNDVLANYEKRLERLESQVPGI